VAATDTKAKKNCDFILTALCMSKAFVSCNSENPVAATRTTA